MTRQIKVRFNLSAGKNYMKWKVEMPNGNTSYYDPSTTKLTMADCQLKNHKATAMKIYNGANKSVCAWIVCTSIYISSSIHGAPTGLRQVKYNPRVIPHWTDDSGSNLDNELVSMIVSSDKKLFVIKN